MDEKLLGAAISTRGNWILAEYSSSNWDSIILHPCPSDECRVWWILPSWDTQINPCPKCKSIVHKDLITAWTLHNWDNISKYNRDEDE